MFKEKPFFGNGLKSFRYKCSDPDYKVKEKILKDKAVYAEDDGYIKIKKNYKVYLINKNKEEIFIGMQFRNQSSTKLKEFEQIKKDQYLGSYYEFENGCNTHPHNTHFQFLAELGLTGYVFLLATILYLIKDIYKLIKKKFYDRLELLNYEKSYIVCLVGLLIQINPLFPSGSFFNNYNSIIFFMIASFLIYFKYIKKT
jgi:O-antigen ligase